MLYRQHDIRGRVVGKKKFCSTLHGSLRFPGWQGFLDFVWSSRSCWFPFSLSSHSLMIASVENFLSSLPSVGVGKMSLLIFLKWRFFHVSFAFDYLSCSGAPLYQTGHCADGSQWQYIFPSIKETWNNNNSSNNKKNNNNNNHNNNSKLWN